MIHFVPLAIVLVLVAGLIAWRLLTYKRLLRRATWAARAGGLSWAVIVEPLGTVLRTNLSDLGYLASGEQIGASIGYVQAFPLPLFPRTYYLVVAGRDDEHNRRLVVHEVQKHLLPYLLRDDYNRDHDPNLNVLAPVEIIKP